MMKKTCLVSILLICWSVTVRGQHVESMKAGDLSAYTDTCSAQILVVNFWATFCKPCVEEMPHFISVVKSYGDKEVRLLFVSVDGADVFPKKLKHFISQRKWQANFAWLNETDASYFCPKIDREWSGSIPATLIINTKRKSRFFVEDAISPEALRDKINTELVKKN